MLIVMVGFATLEGDRVVAQQAVWSESFENGPGPWEGITIRSSDYDAPVEGTAYGMVPGGSDAAIATTPLTIEPGRRYLVTAWARSVYSDDHLALLRNTPDGDLPPGNPAEAFAEIGLVADGTFIRERAGIVNPRRILGAPEDASNDDGANVWVDVDAGFRHAFAENHFYQPLSSDPILAPWLQGELPLAAEQPDMMAKGVAVFPDGTRRIYGFNSNNPFCQGSGENCQAIIFADVIGSGDPGYDQPSRPSDSYIAWHSGDEDPWLGDPHVFVDPTTDRAWLSFGGGTGIYVAELDSESGFMAGFDGPVSFDEHPEAFTKVADWSGDEWTNDSTWFEGAALWRQGGFWYLFTSNGNLGTNYTIRVGRGLSPRGPFLDKLGRDMAVLDAADRVHGNSFVLGDDADQLVPGHPHIWQEGERYFLGYDYRKGKTPADTEEFDIMGIRELHWRNGWPTIWHRFTLEFDADEFPDLHGRPLSIALHNLGDPESIVAYDDITITSACDDCSGDLDLDCSVGGQDLGILLAGWGSTGPPADLNGDGAVNGADLGLLFAGWGPCR